MPSPNIIRSDIDNSFYHVYSRGVNKQTIFNDRDDFLQFQKYLARYLSPYKDGRKSRPNFSNQLTLTAFVLMDNHFHLLIHQSDNGALRDFMRCVANSYVKYFNQKNNRVGPLFQSRYKAALIQHEPYWLHISKYIHRNPTNYKTYPYSSYLSYQKVIFPEWLKPQKVLSSYSSNDAYMKYVED